MIIDSTYFYGRLTLAQKGSPAVAPVVDANISQFETIYLQEILGYKTWKDFTDAIATDTPAQKWIDLRDGKEFTNVQGKLEKWIGFKTVEKLSPIANYVYYRYMENEVSATTGIGEKRLTFMNSINYSPFQKMVHAWNQMVTWNRSLHRLLEVSGISTYPDYVFNYRSGLFEFQNQLGI